MLDTRAIENQTEKQKWMYELQVSQRKTNTSWINKTCTNILAETKMTKCMRSWLTTTKKTKKAKNAMIKMPASGFKPSHLLPWVTATCWQWRLPSHLLDILFIFKYFDVSTSWLMFYVIQGTHFTLSFEFQFLVFDLFRKLVCRCIKFYMTQGATGGNRIRSAYYKILM